MSKKTTLPGLLTISADALIRALQLLLRQAIGMASTDGWQAVERYSKDLKMRPFKKIFFRIGA